MNRTSLITALRAAIAPLGYSFETGDVHSAASKIRTYPAAWLDTPTAVAAEGVNEGFIEYRISIRLLHEADHVAVLDPETAWAKIENDALVFLHNLYIEEGVVHYCVGNMPGAVPRTSTIALTNATLRYGLEIANKGLEGAVSQSDVIASGVNCYDGKVCCKNLADSFADCEYVDVRELV